MANKTKMLKRAKANLKVAEAALRKEVAELDKARKSGHMVHWAEWHTKTLVYVETLADYWRNIVKGIEKMIAKGEDGDAIAAHLRGVRDSLVDQILSREAANKSTSQMANMVRDIRADVIREVAGKNTLDSRSLWVVLYEGGINLK